MPFVPEEAHGKLVIMALMTYAGDPEARPGPPSRRSERSRNRSRTCSGRCRTRRSTRPRTRSTTPWPTVLNDVRRHDRPPRGRRRSSNTSGPPTAMMGVAQLRTLGGAMARVPADATAFAHRQSKIMVNVAALYDTSRDEVAVHGPGVEGFAAALRQGDAGAYVNSSCDEGEARHLVPHTRARCGTDSGQIKARYDPTNLFRLNQNIPPAAEGLLLNEVKSKDGTAIAFDRSGDGPLGRAGGRRAQHAMGGRGHWAALLAQSFTVYVVRPPGQGATAATPPPYEVEREVEDIQALGRGGGRGARSRLRSLLRRRPCARDDGAHPRHHEARAVRAAVHRRRLAPAFTGRLRRAAHRARLHGPAGGMPSSTSW